MVLRVVWDSALRKKVSLRAPFFMGTTIGFYSKKNPCATTAKGKMKAVVSAIKQRAKAKTTKNHLENAFQYYSIWKPRRQRI